MQPEQPEEQLLTALQPLVNQQMGLDLGFPYHEDGGELEPFVWSAEQGEFSPLKLLQSQGWIRSTTTAEVLQLWQAPEIGAVNGDRSLVPEGDPAGILLDESAQAERAKIYTELEQLLETRLQNLEAYELSCDQDYRLGIVVGQIEGTDSWIGVGPTVPIATPADPSPLKTAEVQADVSQLNIAQPNAASTKLNDAVLAIQAQLQAVLVRLASRKIYGYYGGGYNQTHDYKLLQVAATSQAQTIETLLQQVGLWSLSQFEGFAPTISSEDPAAESQQFKALTTFLDHTFGPLWVYRFSFWTWEQVFILGKQVGDQTGDGVGGVVLRSHFTYNP